MKVYIVTGIYRGMEFSVYDVCFTKQDAEDEASYLSTGCTVVYC